MEIIDIENRLKLYIGQLRTKELLIQDLKNNFEIQSIKELEYSIIINIENKSSYEMLYDIENNKIRIKEVSRIACEQPFSII